MPRWAGDFLAAIEVAGDDVAAGLDVAGAFGARLPYPGYLRDLRREASPP
jgi:hypothetical protein